MIGVKPPESLATFLTVKNPPPFSPESLSENYSPKFTHSLGRRPSFLNSYHIPFTRHRDGLVLLFQAKSFGEPIEVRSRIEGQSIFQEILQKISPTLEPYPQ